MLSIEIFCEISTYFIFNAIVNGAFSFQFPIIYSHCILKIRLILYIDLLSCDLAKLNLLILICFLQSP